MDLCGFPKNIYYYYKSWFTDDDGLHISPHWNWKGKEGQPIPVWVNTNADEVELFLNKRSLGKSRCPAILTSNGRCPMSPAASKPSRQKKGKRLTAFVETTSDAHEVVVTPYKTTMNADGIETTVVNISVVDRQGREVPDAGNLIRFRTTGDLHIIGVGNGDPSSHEADRPITDPNQTPIDSIAERHLFNGHCQVILQSGTEPGHDPLPRGGRRAPDRLKPIFRSSTLIQRSTPSPHQTIRTARSQKCWGADISFLPELESRNVHFSDNKGERDAIEILKDHGFNYIRLRIFNEPANDSGYPPAKASAISPTRWPWPDG